MNIAKDPLPSHQFFAFLKLKTHNHSPDCGLKSYYMLLDISSNVFFFSRVFERLVDWATTFSFVSTSNIAPSCFVCFFFLYFSSFCSWFNFVFVIVKCLVQPVSLKYTHIRFFFLMNLLLYSLHSGSYQLIIIFISANVMVLFLYYGLADIYMQVLPLMLRVHKQFFSIKKLEVLSNWTQI